MLLDYKIKNINRLNKIYNKKNRKFNIHISILLLIYLTNCGGSGTNTAESNQKDIVVASGGIAFVSPQISYGVQNSGQAVNPY